MPTSQEHTSAAANASALPASLLPHWHRFTKTSPLAMLAAEGPSHLIRYANPAFHRLLETRDEDLLGHPFANSIAESTSNDCLALLNRVYQTQQAEHLTEQEHAGPGSAPVFWSYAAWAVLDDQAQSVGVVLQVTDATEIARFRRQSAAINEALLLTDVQQQEEIDVARTNVQRLHQAMHETDHRVKNNLQALAALLDMQVMANAKTIAVEDLMQIRLYIMTLASIHDMLTYDVKEAETISLVSGEELLQKLLPMLQGIVGAESIRWHAAPIRLSVKQGISVAVLINELICNAVKHGGHTIELNLRVGSDNRIVLEVCDDGPGFPQGFAPQSHGNFGMMLIESVSRHDLGGMTTYTNRPEGGARIVVTFPLPLLQNPASADNVPGQGSVLA